MSKIFNTDELKAYRNAFVGQMIGGVYRMDEKPDCRDIKHFINECRVWYDEVIIGECDGDISTPEEDAICAMDYWTY